MSGGQATPEVRVDPLSGLRVIVAGGRASRPGGMQAPEAPPPIDVASDPFAEGNENKTPPEVWADRPGGGPADSPGWRVRSVPNLYPALAQSFDDGDGSGVAGDPESDPFANGRGMPTLHSSSPAHGAHEVVINSPRSVQSLAELSLDELRVTMAGWAARIAHHTANADVAYAHLCTNEGKAAGASLPHSHSQLYVLSFVPALIARERERTRAYFEHTQGRSLAEDLLAEEVRDGTRIVAIDDDAALICPFAAATPYRMYVVPRRPEVRFEESVHHGAAMLHAAYEKLAAAVGGNPPLNLWVRTAPRDADQFGWRIEIAPRLGQPAGFELGTGVNINVVPPEDAAANLRDA